MIRINRKFLAALLAVMIIALLVPAFRNAADKQPTAAQPQTSQVILLDAGHGGIDGGAVGVGGTVEKRVNLEIALRLRDVLCDAGYTVIMTREEDISIHDSSAHSIREQKISDLRNRLALTRMYPDSLLVSIHQNTVGDSSVRGAYVFYSPNNAASMELAECVQSSINDSLQPQNRKEIKKAGKNLYLFYNAQNTAVLVECGFLSNSEEERLLCTAEYQDKIVYCIYRGILEHLEYKSPTVSE